MPYEISNQIIVQSSDCLIEKQVHRQLYSTTLQILYLKIASTTKNH